jgi:membrane protein DedA with SNARE-associated domain
MHDRVLILVARYGYAAIFGSMVLGIVGLPVPDEVLMMFAGYLISKGHLHFIPTILLSISGSVLGMSISFAVGRRFGYPLLVNYGPKVGLHPEKLERAGSWFNQYGKWTLTFGYFVPGLRHVTAYFAGMSKWRYAGFLLWAVPGAAVWALTFVMLGNLLGEEWRRAAHLVRHGLLIGAVILAAAAVTAIAVRKLMYRKVEDS